MDLSCLISFKSKEQKPSNKVPEAPVSGRFAQIRPITGKSTPISKANPLVFEMKSKPASKDIDSALAILKDTIPQEELGPVKNLKRQIEKKEQTLLIAKEDKIVVGAAIFREMPETNAALINYLAIDKSCQSKGYGSQILRQLDSSMPKKNPNIKHILLEIEPFNPQSKEDEIKIKRSRFYERSGYQKLDVNYFGINRNNGKPIEYFLLQKSLKNKPETLNLKFFLRCALQQNYGVRQNLDLYIQQMLNPAKAA